MFKNTYSINSERGIKELFIHRREFYNFNSALGIKCMEREKLCFEEIRD
jgi:hypothetical protein